MSTVSLFHSVHLSIQHNVDSDIISQMKHIFWSVEVSPVLPLFRRISLGVPNEPVHMYVASKINTRVY
jgi:hypothetical protein